MKCDRRYHMSNPYFLLGLLAVSALTLYAQSDEDNPQEIRVPEPSEQFTMLTEFELHSHQAKQYAETIEKLNVSRLKTEHQDLIAQALSKAVSGMPIGSFRVSQVME